MSVKQTRAAHRAVIGAGAGDGGWYQIMPLGEFRVGMEGKDGKPAVMTELVDQAALEAIMAMRRADKDRLVAVVQPVHRHAPS